MRAPPITPATLRAAFVSRTRRQTSVAYLSQQKKRAAVASITTGDGGSGLSFDRLSRAEREPHNWPTYWGSYRAEHFSELKEIDRRNVVDVTGQMGRADARQLAAGVDAAGRRRSYVRLGPPGEVYALDARSGLQIWKFHRQQERLNPFQINPYNKGVAVLGKRVFLNTLDNNLIALDARSGRVLWEQNIADTMEGYTMTGAPLALDGKVIVGISGGEMGIRGFISAYDARDGHLLWRFDTIPGPGSARARDLAG